MKCTTVVLFVAALVCTALWIFAPQRQEDQSVFQIETLPTANQSTSSVRSDGTTKDFPYLIKDGHVYCSKELKIALIEEIEKNDRRLDFADSSTFRRPTEEERAEALSRGSGFGIDAVDKNHFYSGCSRINFEGRI